MVIDISKTILRKNIALFITTIVFILIIILLLFVPFFEDAIEGIDNYMLAIFVAVAYIIHAFYRAFRDYNYIYFNDEKDKLILRYFSPNYFTSKKNSIEIPKHEFAGFEIKSIFMGYREKIILFRKTSKGIAHYPPVSITALSIAEKAKFLEALNKLKLSNEKKR